MDKKKIKNIFKRVKVGVTEPTFFQRDKEKSRKPKTKITNTITIRFVAETLALWSVSNQLAARNDYTTEAKGSIKKVANPSVTVSGRAH